MNFERVAYEDLNSRQQEVYNFQKLAGRLADYGYNCIRLTDDWEGADFIALHIDGETTLRVQLKGRLTLNKKYLGKGVYIAFRRAEDFFIYPHDRFLDCVREHGAMDEDSLNWRAHGFRHWPSPPGWAKVFLDEYRV